MIRTFKEFIALNERLFGKVSRGNVPVYLNPTVSDLELLNQSTASIRGFNKDQYIFIWDSNKLSHADMSYHLGEIDPDLKGNPDICFYLYRNNSAPNTQVGIPNNALSFRLLYSSWTGKSTKVSTGDAHLQRLMQFPTMQKLKPFIQNYDDIMQQTPGERHPQQYGDAGIPDHHPVHVFNPQKYSHNDAMWSQKDPKSQNPYRWRSGLHRVGD